MKEKNDVIKLAFLNKKVIVMKLTKGKALSFPVNWYSGHGLYGLTIDSSEKKKKKIKPLNV